MQQRLATWIVLAALVSFGACGGNGTKITAPNAQDPAAEFAQSESVISTGYSSGTNVITVAYNDETNSSATIKYTETERTILTGASLMGWSYSTDQGVNWKYGGKVNPPNGWAVLWGDPALATSRTHYWLVFMANLAIPSSKMPANGISGYVYTGGSGSYIGGACLAKSTDGGRNFANWQCVSNTQKTNEPNSEKGHFYDGAALVSSSSGEVFAAFNDVYGSQIDVWRAADENSTMTRLPQPFPNMTMSTHARLRASQSGDVYVAAQASNGAVYINRWANGQWGSPVQATQPGVIYPEVTFTNTLSLRTGPQFSFDIGAQSDGGGDAIRFLVTVKDDKSGRLYVRGSYCPLGLSPGCSDAPQWGTTPGNLNTPGDQFNPNVSAWAGFIGLPPVWKGSYLDRSGDPADRVSLKAGNLAYLPNGTRIYVPGSLIDKMPLCPDNRGYWGDYNDMMHIGFPKDSTTAQFLATATDSTLGCPVRWEFFSKHQHVQGVRFQ
jgi:hypothetical protein